MNFILDNKYWQNRYVNTKIEWDIGYVAPAFTAFFETLGDKNLPYLYPERAMGMMLGHSGT